MRCNSSQYTGQIGEVEQQSEFVQIELTRRLVHHSTTGWRQWRAVYSLSAEELHAEESEDEDEEEEEEEERDDGPHTVEQ